MDAERFMVVHFTEPHEQGKTMRRWDQHLTIVPWAEGDLEAASTRLERTLSGFSGFEATVYASDNFGPNKNSPVWLIEPTDLLQGLHNAVHRIIKHTATIDDETHLGENYKPHITRWPGHPLLHTDDTFKIRNISIVRKTDNIKYIHKNIRLRR